MSNKLQAVSKEMKSNFTSHKRSIIAALLALLPLLGVSAQEDSLFVYFNGYRLDVFPPSVVVSQQELNNQLVVSVKSDTAYYYDLDRVDSIRHHRPADLPKLTQWKFNNKFNDQLMGDVVGDIIGDSLVTARVGCIGKWLTPSFQLSSDDDRVYLDGKRQWSKESRNKFDVDRIYTISRYGWRVFEEVQLKDAETTTTEVVLTADQFSSNLPGKDGEGFAQMIDGDPSTIYHSTWDVPQEQKPTIYSTEPYIDIALKERLRRISFAYTTRNTGDYWPLMLTLMASDDGQQWTEIRQFTEADGLPTWAGATWQSPEIDLGKDYSHLRLQLNKSGHQLYLVFAEFQLWRIDEVAETAEYAYEMRPFGRNYRVHIDWLTDQPTARVPRIDINTNTGEMISSKEYYLDATISIDGGGVYPDMAETPVQIKGRGNSSWDSWEWAKNPYRLKFASKQKPLGMTNGKSWVLLANKQGGSMLSNAVGMKAAGLVGTAAANHIIPVELYINGNYRGNYNFTEKVGVSNNSIDVANEDSTALLELDTYFDETYRFRSAQYNLPVNIQFPDFAEDPTMITQQMIETDFNNFMRRLKNGVEISSLVDIEMLARYLLVTELIANFELHHPKSTYLYKEAIGSYNSKFVFGPIWDLDWAYGYELNKQYCTTGATSNYYTAVNMEARQWVNDLRYVSKALDRTYYTVWTNFMENHLQELLDYCDDYFAYAEPSLQNNATQWGDGYDYATVTSNTKQWLERRANYVYNSLKVYPIDTPEEEDDMHFDDDHPNGIEIVDADNDAHSLVDVYDINGRLVKRQVSVFDLRSGLRPGIYIVGGRKMVVK